MEKKRKDGKKKKRANQKVRNPKTKKRQPANENIRNEQSICFPIQNHTTTQRRQ
jgi:hypothetical protein